MSEPNEPLIDPRDFDWYTDPETDVVVGCFSFGTGVAEADVAALGRQLAVELAEVLRIRQAFITVPHLLVVDERRPVALEDDDGRPGPRPAFAVFRSLPETQIVRDASRQIGARLALTGRLMGAGLEFKIGVNLIDVERLTLLGCCSRTCEREALMETVADIGLYLLQRFLDTDEDALMAEVRDALGTQDYRAFYHWALACDMDRGAAAGIRALDAHRMMERLRFGVGRDPGYTRVLDRILDLFDDFMQAGDTASLLRLANTFEFAELAHPTLALMRAECLIACGERERAREVLGLCMTQFPSSPHAFYLMGTLEQPERPSLALTFFQRATERAPSHPLYRERYDALKHALDSR